MIEETDVCEEKKWWYQNLAQITVANFRKRNVNAEYVSTRAEALRRILGLIPKDATVGWGDSVTLHQLGIVSELKKCKQNLIFDPFERDDSGSLITMGEERLILMRKAMSADFFLSSVNAITMDGKMVSTDATGNRVAPIIFGPKRVIIVAGANKIVKNLDEAFRRIKEVAAPINVKRHLIKHNSQRFGDLPCAKKGICVDCSHAERICLYTVIIEGERNPGSVTNYVPRIYVVIVGEELGI
jgi:hypothetical protein